MDDEAVLKAAAEPVTAASIRDDREVLRKAERIRIRSRFPPADNGLSVYAPETIVTAILDDGEEVSLGDGVAAVTWEERAGECPVATVELLGVDLDAEALPPRLHPDVPRAFEPGTYVHHKGWHYAALGLVRDHRTGRELVRYVALREATQGMPHRGEEVRELEPRAGCDAWNDPVRWPDGQVRSRFMPLWEMPEARLPPHCNGVDCKRPLFDGDAGGPCACRCSGCWPVETRDTPVVHVPRVASAGTLSAEDSRAALDPGHPFLK